MATVTMVFRKSTVTKDGKSPIYFRVTKNRKHCYISSGEKVEERYWDFAKNKVKPNHPSSGRLNAYLTTKLQEIHSEVLLAETTEQHLTGKDLRNSIFGQEPTNFFKYANLSNEKVFEAGKIGTFDKNKSVIAKLYDYNKQKPLYLQSITPGFLNSYESYLRAKGNCTNTIGVSMRYIKKIFNDAYREGLVEHKQIPFNAYKIKSENTQRCYLSDEELALIESLNIKEDSKMALHRDMFVFSSYAAGLRVGDVLSLQVCNYDGQYIHTAIRKTGGQISIKLPTKAKAIVDNYIMPDSSPTDYIFPILPKELNRDNPVCYDAAVSSATAYYNKDLKVIAKKCKIEKTITSHVARHSFATRALIKGVSLDKVSKFLGHTNLSTTQLYAKVVNSELDKAMEVFN